MNYFNFHTHTFFCDGNNTAEEFVSEAIRKGMTAIGFSSHSPLPFENDYSIKETNIDEYKSQIRNLQQKYKDRIDIFLALEFDYVTGISENFDILKKQVGLDYTIGSVHLVKSKSSKSLWFIDGPDINYTHGLSHIFQNNIRLAVKTYFEQIQEMIITQKPDIIGHIDKVKMNNKGRFFTEEESWYKELAIKTLEITAKTNCIIEVNTRGIYKKRSDSLYPGIFILKKIYKMNIPITLSSDAHSIDELTAYFPETIGILKDIGFKKVKYFTNKGWIDQAI
jgi:histidinol-phosphatase (PHP family)